MNVDRSCLVENIKMYFILLVFLGLQMSILAQTIELRCFECENCPGPIKERDIPIIKCHEGNVITSTTEPGTTIEVTEEYYTSNGEESEEVSDPGKEYDDEESEEDEMEFACYSMIIEGKVSFLIKTITITKTHKKYLLHTRCHRISCN